jgi:hypothetical protein
MNTKKTLIVGLFATIGCGLLQAESLTFNFTTIPSSPVTFAGGDGTAFSGGLSITSLTSTQASSTCNLCTLNFTTGGLTGFSSVGGVGGSAYFYGFGANNSGTAVPAVTGAGGSLNNPTPPGTPGTVTGANSTLMAGSLAATSPLGAEGGTGPTSIFFSIPVSANNTGNLLTTILADFGLTGTFPISGTLAFTVNLPGAPGGNGSFDGGGTVSGGTLSLNVASLSATPEPSSVLLLGLGLICVAFVGRKRMLAHRI